MDLLNVELQADKVEEYLQGLVDGIDNLEEVEEELGLDIRNMVKLLDQYPHNDDIHHHGESILEHIREVLEDVQTVTEGKDKQQRQLLGLVALLHDLGKAYTYELRDVGGKKKHTFYKHAEISVKLAEAMLRQLRENNVDLYKRVLDLIRLHDIFMRLMDAQRGSKDLKYLNKFMRESVYLDDHLDDLVTFSKADSFRAKRFQDTLNGVEAILEDIRKVEQQQKEEEEARARRQALPPDVEADLRILLEAEAPDVAPLLPDLKEVNRALGRKKMYPLLRQVQDVVNR